MRYLIAAGISLALIIAMFVYHAIMMAKMREWCDLGVELPVIYQWLIQLAQIISAYWYALVPAIIIGVFSIAALRSRR